MTAAARPGLLEPTRGSRERGDSPRAKAALDAAGERSADARRRFTRAAKSLARGRQRQPGDPRLGRRRLSLRWRRASGQQAEEQHGLVRSGPRAERIAAAAPRWRRRMRSVAAVDAALGNTTVRPPFAGVVTVKNREPGGDRRRPAAGGDGDSTRTTAGCGSTCRENRIGAVHLDGGPRSPRTPAAAGRTRARSSSSRSEAEFTPRSVQTAGRAREARLRRQGAHHRR